MDRFAIKILVLDDELFTLKLLDRMLRDQGYSLVQLCKSGFTALELLDVPDTRPDLILCDLSMPEMDGVQFVRELVRHNYHGSLLLVSGQSERTLKAAENAAQAHGITVLGYLNKPVTPQSLLAVLAQGLPQVGGKRLPAKTYTIDELAVAITDGQLVNYYQPKVSVLTGLLIGVETLVRWRHPIDGLVPPDLFIELAETNGLIDDLTRCVLSSALQQSRIWRDAGLNLQVAVNISMANLAALDFPDAAADLAIAAGVSAEDITLEVTESQIMKDRCLPLDSLARLRLKKFALSIDDFGTGYSSLAQLRDIPFDELKIDQSFVHHAWKDKTLRAIYDASLALANQLHMTSVAEGVENLEDWHLVQRTGCTCAQGYFIARPMPANKLPCWIESWQERLGHLLPASH